MNVLLLLFAILGHAFLWIGLINRMHAIGWRRKTIKIASMGLLFCATLIPVLIGWCHLRETQHPTSASCGFAVSSVNVRFLISAYIIACWTAAMATLLRLIYFRILRPLPSIVRFHGRRRVELDPAANGDLQPEHHFLAHLPLNEILRLELTQWTLDVPRLPPALDGLSIVHLSDLHFTGRVDKSFFRQVVRTSNELKPDLVCITGDIVDRSRCIDWFADTLEHLRARHGVFFVLGNHDRCVDVARLSRTLQSHGLIDIGGRRLALEIAGCTVELIGNERPWFGQRNPAGCMQHTGQAASEDGAFHTPCGFRIVLSHSPDQFAWARAQDADLMLAGHTHGGQICIPPLGAILSPSFWGVKYISGVFYEPPTIMHVTRGVSGDVPIRWNCPPEISHLRLRADRTTMLTASE